MCSSSNLTVACVCLAVFTVVNHTTSQSDKPVKISEMMVDRVEPPPSLKDMWLSADAIAVVRVLHAAVAARMPGKDDQALPRTVYEVEVEDILKASSHLAPKGRTARLERLGGTIDRGKYLVKYIEHGFPDFLSGSRYLLFLGWNNNTRMLYPRDGPDSTYELVENVVRTHGHGPVARALDEQSSDEVLDKLRALRREGGH